MIRVVFYIRGAEIAGFEFSGHSGYEEEGRDIICASISSAAYMTANTITDVIGDEADIEVSDGFMRLTLGSSSKETQAMLKGLKLHVENLSQDYKKYISCKQTLVKE